MPDPRPLSWHQQPDIANLSPDSYTAQKLQHATPDHLHLTSRRFFIGPIPEGWLKSHRRDWYKHHLHINYHSRTASFSSDPRDSRQRRITGLDGPSSSALFSHSFPQPEDLSEDEGDHGQDEGAPKSKGGAASAAETSTAMTVPRASSQRGDVLSPEEEAEFVDAPSEPDENASEEFDADAASTRVRRASTKSFVTASTSREDSPSGIKQIEDGQEQEQASSPQLPPSQEPGQKTLGKQPASAAESSNGTPSRTTVEAPSVDAVSTSSLLPEADRKDTQPESGGKLPSKNIVQRVKRRSHRTTTEDGDDQSGLAIARTKSHLRNLVKFDIPEDSKRAEIHLKAKAAQMTIQRASTRLRRSKLKDGLVVKMERMLVRVDSAGKEVPEDFDENGNQKIDSRVKEKWREYMVVCRQSISEDADFVLQMYKTRVIPEIEQGAGSKRAAYQIPLGKRVARVNMYSSLDKSVVVWMPVSRGTRIFIMQARTASNATEWYTFLRNIMGWRRASELQINIPDLSISLRLADPFKKLEASQNDAERADEGDNEEAILKTMKEEQAVAENLTRRCLDQLEDSPEWADVLDSWVRDQRIGLAWKRYDRLEWIHGANERKMYGTIAMQKSHELELRPKSHYPTTVATKKKRKLLTEPVPVEGFLIRLTSQRGRDKRMGLMYHKQLYFSTHDRFLVFSRPTKADPPPPPKLPASTGAGVPSARAIVDQTPDTWAVNPYPVKDGKIEWLMEGHSGTPEARRLHDEDAEDEDARKANILLNCDGYMNLADIIKVRKAKIDAVPEDDNMDSGSDEEVDDSAEEDGAIKKVDVDRTFELVFRNRLIVRLQAANKERRKEWIKHLRALVKYWRNRASSDIALFKSTRAQNLTALNIDEEAEAYVGQFAKKWEVTQSYACPELYNFCGIACCRRIHMSGSLYRKPRIHAAFQRCNVILTSGTLLIFQDVLRGRFGKQVPHAHHERVANLDLKDCYIYSGFLTESDLLYQNQTFDANKPGHHALPRVYLEDGWTSTDEDVMTTFVIWHGKSKSWFRSEEGAGGGEQRAKERKRSKLKRVAKLGSKGRSLVFRARSRAERDHWVLAIQNEIERVQLGTAEDFRIEESLDGKGTTNGTST
ncbi:meiotically up-regulated gene 56 protein [Polyplosphaeria fusca]|uniref:Meiotically up-regulated gene 56 protein n=1 Tax=Polyplosphaeria fusca TaxID=682080 RepID=A0A9P4QQT8_9PLEO|nr:meiotically up-regulated gene 56 protein [Polyplosphaeria fusca]